MKKIMFNDKYGLTQAVLEGRKTMTRRIIKDINGLYEEIRTMEFSHIAKDGDVVLRNAIGFAKMSSKYKVGEKIAIAQSYKGIYDEYCSNGSFAKAEAIECLSVKSGWNNKMFVRADLMPHAIEITDIKVERLQDISDAACLREGIGTFKSPYYFDPCYHLPITSDKVIYYKTPREAFAALINKVSGKGTWNSNPWVFAYEFKLID